MPSSRCCKLILIVAVCSLVTYESLDAQEIRQTPERTSWREILAQMIRVKAGIAVIEVSLIDNAAFEVGQSFFGDLPTGQRLKFSECQSILRIGSTEEYIRSIVNAPLVQPRSPGGTTTLSPDAEANTDARPDASFIIIVWRLSGSSWGFVRQTHGDLFLVQDDVVFHIDHAETLGQTPAWVPLVPKTSRSQFIAILANEINRRTRSGLPNNTLHRTAWGRGLFEGLGDALAVSIRGLRRLAWPAASEPERYPRRKELASK